ncbi:uncharacterized protein LOC112460729 [Temnothorax curvispinosus]|uniref:Uncharacterized protein LOC112460729 n=1 Tax=Temnothorax curvispinosus TaxID=300111 RepID=A0A6J1QG24_9HYME|nr:uncharacterized protein LOC112460729 [Temnothorax curvispinosus]
MAWDLLTNAEKARANWLMANHHGFRWKDGDVDYRLARSIIRRAVCDDLGERRETPGARIYVKELEKKRWLEEILGDAVRDVDATIETIDDEYDDIDRLEFLRADRAFRCGRHQRCCAMENVMKLRDWWNERRDCFSSINSTDQI